MTRLAIGIGCRRGVAGERVAALVRDTLRDACLDSDGAGLFSIDAKSGEPGLLDAATALAMPLTFVSRETLAAISTPTRSTRSQDMFGVGSVAEGAALAGAGRGAVLAVGRVARDGVTCAIALAAP